MIYISDQNIYVNPLHIESVKIMNTMGDMYVERTVFIYTNRDKYKYFSGNYIEAYKAKDALIDKINSYLNGLSGLK